MMKEDVVINRLLTLRSCDREFPVDIERFSLGSAEEKVLLSEKITLEILLRCKTDKRGVT